MYDRADLSDLQPPPEPQDQPGAEEVQQPEGAEPQPDPQQAAGVQDPPAEQQSRQDEGSEVTGPQEPPVVILPSMVEARPAHQAPFDPSRPPPAPVAAAEDGGLMAPREPPPDAIL